MVASRKDTKDNDDNLSMKIKNIYFKGGDSFEKIC